MLARPGTGRRALGARRAPSWCGGVCVWGGVSPWGVCPRAAVAGPGQCAPWCDPTAHADQCDLGGCISCALCAAPGGGGKPLLPMPLLLPFPVPRHPHRGAAAATGVAIAAAVLMAAGLTTMLMISTTPTAVAGLDQTLRLMERGDLTFRLELTREKKAGLSAVDRRFPQQRDRPPRHLGRSGPPLEQFNGAALHIRGLYTTCRLCARLNH